MRITDIGKGKLYEQGGQEHKWQTVNTPYGQLDVPSFVRIPRLKASKRTWKVWYKRFIEHPKNMKAFWETHYLQKRIKERKSDGCRNTR
jgi:hypothetical protein